MARSWPILLAVLLAAAPVVCAPATAQAADEKKPGEPAKKTDILSPRFDLTLWSIVVFVLLLLVLWKWAWGPMLEGLRNREDNIRKALDDAEQAKRETAEMREKLQAEMAKANEMVRARIEEGQRAAQQSIDEMMAKARAEILAERERLRREVDMARDQAIKELWEQTALLATQVSSRVVRRQLNVDDHRRLVDEALAELRQAASDKVRAN
jgi:F-type H+-transporting ATPase subunit b